MKMLKSALVVSMALIGTSAMAASQSGSSNTASYGNNVLLAKAASKAAAAGTTASSQASSQSSGPSGVKFNSDKNPITVKSDSPEFNVTISSNPTTGYSWFLEKYNRQLIASVSHGYVAPNSKLMGASGYEVWTFKALPAAFTVPQSTNIVIEYARPWEKDKGTVSSFKVYFVK